MESRDQAPNSWWCTSSFFPRKCSLWGWHSVGLQTEAIGFTRCPPVLIPPCKLFIPPAPFCERGLQLHVGLFSQFQGSKIPLGAIHRGYTWERRDSHSEFGASLLWQDERQSPGEEVKRQLLWVVPGPSPAPGTQGCGSPYSPSILARAPPLLPPFFPGGQKPWGIWAFRQGWAQLASVGSGSRTGFGGRGESLEVAARGAAMRADDNRR